MRIIFDVWFAKTADQMTAEENLLVRTIHDFIYERLKILTDEMNKEEQIDNRAVYVELEQVKIYYRGYSAELTEKLKSCFNERDGLMLLQRIDEAFNKFT
jgi:hypothetical protein